jgi:hypothetical protein
MTSAAAGLIAHTRDLHKLSVESLHGWGARVAAWLIAGNAAALVISYNAVINASVCNRDGFAQILWSFALGLGAAFVGVIITLVAGMMSSLLLGNIVNLMGRVEMDEINLQRLEARYGPQPEDNILQQSITDHLSKVPQIEKQLRALVLVACASFLFYGASATLFARGTILPVTDATVLQSCTPHAPPATTRSRNSGAPSQ